jgi:hypothetical protein
MAPLSGEMAHIPGNVLLNSSSGTLSTPLQTVVQPPLDKSQWQPHRFLQGNGGACPQPWVEWKALTELRGTFYRPCYDAPMARFERETMEKWQIK